MAEPACKKARFTNLQPWVPEDLAETLDANSGIASIERFVFDANDVMRSADVAKRAAAVVEKEGIVLIRGALEAPTIEAFRKVFPELIAQVRQFDPEDKGSRGEKRHSFGGMSSTNSQLHREEFRSIIDVPAVTEVLEQYWGSKDFAVAAAGGDLNMAGSRQHQILHSDLSRHALFGPGTALGKSVKTPMIAVNYLIEDQTPFNGPLQHIPGTQLLDLHYIPEVPDEPKHWFFSTMCPAPAGTAVIRDIRAWHAGTPNITTKDRPLPNCEFISPSAASDPTVLKEHRIMKGEEKQLSHEVWESLPERARHLTRFVKAEKGQAVEPKVIYRVLGFAEKCVVSPVFSGCVAGGAQ